MHPHDPAVPEGTVPGRVEALRRLEQQVLACRACEQRGYITRACPLFHNLPTADIMLIGQAPGRISEERRRHFSGPGGRILRAWLQRAGLPLPDFERRVFLTSLTRCFPGPARSGSGDRRPSPEECALCRPFLHAELAIIQPRLVLLVGKMAIDTFIPGAAGRRMDELVGTIHDDGERVYVPLPHPSGRSRWLNNPRHRALLERALGQVRAWLAGHGTAAVATASSAPRAAPAGEG
jgi:uracil-DNA glycosylase family 4